MPTFDEIKEQQRKLWNKFSPGWNKWDSFVIGWLRPIGDKLIETVQLRDGEKLLDVATGTGEPGLSAAKQMPQAQVIGIDIAEEMVAIANAHAKEQNVRNYSAQKEDLSQKLSFADNHFDKAVCRFGIMYFPNPASDLKEVVRVVKPGGAISFAAWAEPNKNPWATTASSVINRLLNIQPLPPDTPGVFRHGQAGLLQKIFDEAGLVDTKQEEITGNMAFTSPEDYWEFVMDVIAPVAVPLSQTDEATRQKAKEEVISECKKFQNEKGNLVFTWSSWIASGIKPI